MSHTPSTPSRPPAHPPDHQHQQPETDRRARVGQVAAFPPGEVEAADELQVERVGGVEHGEAHDVGLVVHNVIQPQEREILHGANITQGKENERVFQMSDHADGLSSVG